MACFLLRGPLGERWMPESQTYQRLKGEAIVEGAIRWDCGPQNSSSDDLMNKLAAQGIQWGDAIAYVTHKLGIEQCSPCKATQELFNESLILGLKDTARRIKEFVQR